MNEKLKGCFSHESDHWSTPADLYCAFADNGFFDPCPLNCKDFDGLSIPWSDCNFVNPPYSQISKWVDKAISEHQKGKTVFLLVPARTDTKWFKTLYDAGINVVFLNKRLHFGNSKGSAPFPSMICQIVGWTNGGVFNCQSLEDYIIGIRRFLFLCKLKRSHLK